MVSSKLHPITIAFFVPYMWAHYQPRTIGGHYQINSHLNQDQDLWSNIMFAKCSDDVQFSMMQSGGYVFYIRIGLNNVFGSENKEDTVTLQKTLAGHTIWSNNALFRRERNEIHRHAKTLHSKSWRIRILGNANVFSCLDIVVIYRLMRRPFIFLTRKTNLVYQMSISL